MEFEFYMFILGKIENKSCGDRESQYNQYNQCRYMSVVKFINIVSK